MYIRGMDKKLTSLTQAIGWRIGYNNDLQELKSLLEEEAIFEIENLSENTYRDLDSKYLIFLK